MLAKLLILLLQNAFVLITEMFNILLFRHCEVLTVILTLFIIKKNRLLLIRLTRFDDQLFAYFAQCLGLLKHAPLAYANERSMETRQHEHLTLNC